MISDLFQATSIEQPQYVSIKRKQLFEDEYRGIGKDEAQKNMKGMLPFIAHHCMCLDIDREFWETKHTYYKERNLNIIKLLDQVFRKLEEKGCTRVCVTENFSAVLASDSCIGCFASGDVDLFVDIEMIPIVKEVMDEMGFSLGDRIKRKKCFAYEYYNETILGTKFWLNFQWAPLTRKKTHLYDQYSITRRLYQELDRTIRYKDTAIKLLSNDAMMYFNLHHIASGHYFIMSPEFRLYADIDRPLRALNINLEKLARWAKEDDAGFRIAMPLYICNRFLETPCDLTIVMSGLDVRRFNKLKSFLINEERMTIRKPPKNIPGYLFFLTRIELLSDGTSLTKALLRRLKGLFKKELAVY